VTLLAGSGRVILLLFPHPDPDPEEIPQTILLILLN
jgi:hypothetical protein